MTITRKEFRDAHQGGIRTNDAQTLDRLKQAGVDGKKLLADADLNKDGTVGGAAELDRLFTSVDNLDRDGSRHTISDQKPAAVLAALKQPAMPGGPVDQSKLDDLYGPSTTPAAMGPGAKGPEVKSVQEKLLRAGYELPRFGADGSYGQETVNAVKKFQGDQKPPLPATGTVDDATMRALDAAKPVTGPKPAGDVRFPEYDKMFKDGVLQTTVAVGYDEDGNDLNTRRGVLEGLQQRGFQKLDVANLSDDQLRAKGFDPATIDRNATYYTKGFEHDGKPVQALVRLVDRDSPNAKEQFAKGMKHDDLILYDGHGRRGSGPDFDADKSAAGNYVIGKPYEDGHYALGQNDLKKRGALGNQYQMMVFSACTSNHYVDDLRQVKGSKSLDILATKSLLNWDPSASSTLAALDGVMGGKSINDITSELERVTTHDGKNGAWSAHGFKDNTYQPGR